MASGAALGHILSGSGKARSHFKVPVPTAVRIPHPAPLNMHMHMYMLSPFVSSLSLRCAPSRSAPTSNSQHLAMTLTHTYLAESCPPVCAAAAHSCSMGDREHNPHPATPFAVLPLLAASRVKRKRHLYLCLQCSLPPHDLPLPCLHPARPPGSIHSPRNSRLVHPTTTARPAPSKV